MDSGSVKKRGKDNGSPISKKIYDSLSPLIKHFKEEYKLTKEDLINIYEGIEEIKVPLSIFSKLSPLEALVKFLKENLGLRFSEIASKLNRDDRSIWRTYQQAKYKNIPFELKKDELLIPLSIFKNRNLSILENLVVYLKSNINVSVKEISFLVNKSLSTIWTAYNRAKKKLK